jgi:hypothetical protein
MIRPRGRSANRRIPSTVRMLAPRHSLKTVPTVMVMSKKDGPAKRLEYWIECAKQDRYYKREPVPDVFSKDITIPAEGPFTLPRIWEPVRDAFRALGLNVDHPYDWQRLLYYLAETHFGKRRGNPKAWNEKKLCRLAVDFETTKKANPGESDEKIYKKLLTNDRYKNSSVKTKETQRLDRDWKTLRRRLPAARLARKRTIERLATAMLLWQREYGAFDQGPATKERAIQSAEEALERCAAPPLIRGPGDDAMWNTLFGDPANYHFWLNELGSVLLGQDYRERR